jgi:hypothetical protein
VVVCFSVCACFYCCDSFYVASWLLSFHGCCWLLLKFAGRGRVVVVWCPLFCVVGCFPACLLLAYPILLFLPSFFCILC